MALAIRHDVANDVIVLSDDKSPKHRALSYLVGQSGGGVFALLAMFIWAIFLFGSTSAAETFAAPTRYIAAIILGLPLLMFSVAAYRTYRRAWHRSHALLIFSPDGLHLSWLGDDAPFLPWSDISEAVGVDKRRQWLKTWGGNLGREKFGDVMLVVRPDWASRLVRLLPRQSRRVVQDKYVLVLLRSAVMGAERPELAAFLQLPAFDLLWIFGRYIDIQDLPQGYRPAHASLSSLSPRVPGWPRLPASRNGIH